MNFVKKTLSITALLLSVALIASINLVLASTLGAWLVAADIAFVVVAAILVSHFFNLSIPGVRQVLRRAYFRAKFKRERKKKVGALSQVYLQFLAYLILLFKSADEGFDVIKEEAAELYSDALIFIDKHKEGKSRKPTTEHFNQLFDIHTSRQKRAATVTVSTLGVFILGVISIGLLSNMIFSPATPSEAATYGWIQDDWSGGSSTSTADHTDDRTGWTKFFTKDPNVDVETPGQISLSSPMEDWVETTATEFESGTHENTTVTEVDDGEVALLKPVGASCSNHEECSTEICDDSSCSDCGDADRLQIGDYNICAYDPTCDRADCEVLPENMPTYSEYTDMVSIDCDTVQTYGGDYGDLWLDGSNGTRGYLMYGNCGSPDNNDTTSRCSTDNVVGCWYIAK